MGCSGRQYVACMILQEYGGWDLSKVLKTYKKIAGWCDKHVKSIIYQMLCGLLYMQVGLLTFIPVQSANIVHRDLKPSNVLVDSKCNVKLIDYGLARQMCPQTRKVALSTVGVPFYFNSSLPPTMLSFLHISLQVDATDTEWDSGPKGTDRQLTQHVVTRWYRAPELILMQSQYDGAIDVWSVGCIMVSSDEGDRCMLCVL